MIKDLLSVFMEKNEKRRELGTVKMNSKLPYPSIITTV
jgi:hypothetical protein